MRANPNKNKDILFCNNENYLLFRKNGQTEGTLGIALDLISLGINNLEIDLKRFKKKSQKKLLDSMIEDLKTIKDNI